MKAITLKSGYSIPQLGLGTWRLSGTNCINAVRSALDLGYRHIDTAGMYENHQEIGTAIKASSVDRSELFLTSKIWYSDLHYTSVISQCEYFLKQLQTDYLDLLLIHWPNKDIPLSETLRAFDDLVKQKKVLSIGVSNFSIKALVNAQEASSFPIAVNQVECHPYLTQFELRSYCKEKGIALTAYSPLGKGRIFEDETLKDLAIAYKASIPAIILKWHLQVGNVVIPKATQYSHLKDNFAALDLPDLSQDDIGKIEKLNNDKRFVSQSWADFG